MKGKRVLILFLIVILFIPISSPGGAKRYKKRKANFSYGKLPDRGDKEPTDHKERGALFCAGTGGGAELRAHPE